MYGILWESRKLRFFVMIIEQLRALKTDFCKLTSRQKTMWYRYLDSWTPSRLRDHLLWLAEHGGFIEFELAIGQPSSWRGDKL